MDRREEALHGRLYAKLHVLVEINAALKRGLPTKLGQVQHDYY